MWSTYNLQNRPTSIDELNTQCKEELLETSDVLARSGEVLISTPIEATHYHNLTWFTQYPTITIKVEPLH